MNREKEKKVLTVYALTILTCLLVLIGVKVWEESPAGNFFEACEEMDRIEPRYDADGYFIMVSTKDALVGTYWCNTPLKHYRCRVCLKVLTPQVHTVDDIENIGIDMDSEDLWEIYQTVPDGTPLLIY